MIIFQIIVAKNGNDFDIDSEMKGTPEAETNGELEIVRGLNILFKQYLAGLGDDKDETKKEG